MNGQTFLVQSSQHELGAKGLHPCRWEGSWVLWGPCGAGSCEMNGPSPGACILSRLTPGSSHLTDGAEDTGSWANTGHFPGSPPPALKPPDRTVSPPSARGNWQTQRLLPHPRVGGPQPGCRSLLLLSYLRFQAPTPAAQESIPAPGQVSAVFSKGARSQSRARGPPSISLPGSVFLFAQQPC